MFEGIKKKMGLKQARREFRNLRRVGKVYNLGNAQSVCLIYKADSEEKYVTVKNYVKHLKEEEGVRKIMALGYVDDKIVPDYLRPKLEFDFFCNKDLAWNYRPGGTVIKNFVNEPYDILIDMEQDEIVPLRYVLNWSQAKFKVGYFNKDFQHYYDLMLDVKSGELVDYIAQVNYYLSIINKTT
ncbi:MAG: DUF6913 domain-containing protein [Bacteroidota bacterium]